MAALGKLTPAQQAPRRVYQAIELHSPVTDKLSGYISENRRADITMARQGQFAGKTAAICGAGPSLTGATITGADLVFACNSALPYLQSHGVKVDAAVGIDQTLGLLREWADPDPSIPYFVASSCDPATIAHLRLHECELFWFHNYVGVAGEPAIYGTWPDGFMVGEGMTVVSRFIGLAQWMGIERLDIYGADCAFGPDDQAHANGENAEAAYGNPLVMVGKLPPSPREWRTRPDMLRDAVHLVKRVRAANGTIRLMGDTLPVALLGKTDDYLDTVSRTLAPGEVPPAPSTGV
jgi:hypothetical protein